MGTFAGHLNQPLQNRPAELLAGNDLAQAMPVFPRLRITRSAIAPRFVLHGVSGRDKGLQNVGGVGFLDAKLLRDPGESHRFGRGGENVERLEAPHQGLQQSHGAPSNPSKVLPDTSLHITHNLFNIGKLYWDNSHLSYKKPDFLAVCNPFC